MFRRATLAMLFLFAWAAMAPPAHAEGPFSLGVFVGTGGSIDENEAGLGNGSVMGKIAFETRPRTDFAVRFGEIEIDQVAQVEDATLTFVLLTGDYWAYEAFYESAFYLGLGHYEVAGLEGFQSVSESTIGVVLGAAGEFDMTESLSFQLDLSAHYAPMDIAQTFLMAHAGVAVHF